MDPEGRFLPVKGVIKDYIYSFISYYTPTKCQAHFFHSMFLTLGPLVEDTVIFGGDSNIAFDEGLDKAWPLGRLVHSSKQSLRITKMIYQQGLVDIWREINPTVQDYTHFSCPHNSLFFFS